MTNCELYFRYLFIRNYFYLTIFLFNIFYLITSHFTANFVIELINSPLWQWFKQLLSDIILRLYSNIVCYATADVTFLSASGAGNWRDRDSESSSLYFIWGASTGVRVTSTKLISRRSWLSRNSVSDLLSFETRSILSIRMSQEFFSRF